MSASRPGSRRALVAGAGGFLGSSVVRALTDAGWNVRGLAHSPRGAHRIEEAGGFSVTGDVLDAAAVDAAARGCEVIVHVAAASAWGPGGAEHAERVRVEGCRNLLRAARQHRVGRLVVGSGYWVYADHPGTITEESPLDPRGESRINWTTEQVALDPVARVGPEVIVVRPGMVYGDGSWFRSMYDAIRSGTYRYIGDGSNPWSFVSLEDTGVGFARVVEAGGDGEVYNLVDGRPASWREFAVWVAGELGRPEPVSATMEEATAEFGPEVAHHLHARRALSAAKIEGIGFTPRYRDYRDGGRALLSVMRTGEKAPE